VDDLRFEVTVVPQAERFRAARLAVLGPFTKSAILHSANNFQIDDIYQKVRKRWHKVLEMLAQHLVVWSRIDNPLKEQYLRNCPPAGVVTEDKARHCDCPLLCPFWWGRRIVEVFRAFERALWPDPKDKDYEGHLYKPFKEYRDHRLVYFSRAMPLATVPAMKDYAKTHADHEDRVIEATTYGLSLVNRRSRRQEVDALRKNEGGVVLHRLLYRRTTMPVFVRSGVLLLPPKVKVRWPGYNPDAIDDLKYWTLPLSKENLVIALAQVAKYSEGWLLHATAPELMGLLLAGSGKKRLVQLYGRIRPSLR
jgi:hypothetical protein